jgi:hypothetical protein
VRQPTLLKISQSYLLSHVLTELRRFVGKNGKMRRFPIPSGYARRDRDLQISKLLQLETIHLGNRRDQGATLHMEEINDIARR